MSTHERRDGWRKSSFSDTGNGCVEIAHTLAAIRDSKNLAGPTLTVRVNRLVRAVKTGTLDA
ncbi:DUF397 domain-containing protein [Actinokineospora sp.]|uniref:DUF397 domain-containing protein n=1 Tax=Actinokineospora sp. TaxID=1872133 RepID=UPI004037DED7